MLTIIRNGDIVTVTETDPGGTTIRYNTSNWTMQINGDEWKEVEEDHRVWVEKHYLPKAKKQ